MISRLFNDEHPCGPPRSPGPAFTEHIDFSRWTVDEVVLQRSPLRRELTGPDGVLAP